ncbi:MAG: DUF433 domain-containing protein [Chloroflexota bacterium]
METIQSINLISINPKVRAGRPCIAGTGLRVTDVAIASLFHDKTPDDIASGYDVSLAQVYAALAYYYQHKTALDADIQAQIKKARELKENRVGSRRDSLLS